MLAHSRYGPLVVAVAILLGTHSVSAAVSPISVLSGKIVAVDKTSSTITIEPANPGIKQTLRFSAETVVAVGKESGGVDRLATGQRVTIFYNPETRLISRLRVAVVAEGAATSRSAMRPKFPAMPGAFPLDGANAHYKLSVWPVKTVQATHDYEMKIPSIAASEWIVIAPAPPELPSQTDVHNVLEPGGALVEELSPMHRPLLTARVPAEGWEQRFVVSARAEYRATLMGRRLMVRQPGEPAPDVPPLKADERRAALTRSKTFDFDSPAFRKWLDAEHLSREASEGQVDYARRVFLVIKRKFAYEFAEKMNRQASHICTVERSDCGGLSIAFASALRAHDIPARLLVGRWATSARQGERAAGAEYYQSHVKAEFYANGVGWIPVDLASGVLYDRSREGLRFFGRDNGDFLTLHLDPDLVVDTVLFGSQPAFCINGGMLVWVNGSGSAERPKVRQGWRVRELPLAAQRESLPGPESTVVGR